MKITAKAMRKENKMGDCMTFPDTVEEYMEECKIVDTERVYTNGVELVPIFRMNQWFEHLSSAKPEPERKTGRWIRIKKKSLINCSVCKRCSWSFGFDRIVKTFNYCPNCGADMRGET